MAPVTVRGRWRRGSPREPSVRRTGDGCRCLGGPAWGLCRLWWFLCRWADGVVPLTVELVLHQRHRCQLLVAYLDPKGVVAPVQLGADPQARVGRGRPDQLDDHLMADERPTTPVHRDRAEQPMLDPVPLGGPWRQVADSDLQPRLGRQPGQLGLPRPDPVAVGTTSISRDQQPLRPRVGGPADLLPPAPQRLDRERRGIVVDPDTDPAGIAPKVIDP